MRLILNSRLSIIILQCQAEPLKQIQATVNCEVYILHVKIKLYTDLGDHLGPNSQP